MSLFATGDLIQLVANLLYSGYVPIQMQGSHAPTKLPSCSNSITICGGISECAFQTYEVLS